jgi:hypothetical protein
MPRSPSFFGGLLLAFVLPSAQAGSRTSANYTVAAEVADGGGRRAASARYTHVGRAGAVAGIFTVAATTAKSGYVAQLYDVTGLVLGAAQFTVNEGASLPLAAWRSLDDSSLLAVPAATVAWSVLSGPFSGIGTGGIATAQTVYQDTAGVVQGTLGGFTGTLGLTVKNVATDDFGTYAADGLDDAWQVLYFGLNNPQAAPTFDATGTGQTNLFKYVAGLNPIDPSARFTLTVQPVSGQPALPQVIFSPRFADRSYQVFYKDDLAAANWTPLTGGTVSDSGTQRTVVDLSANGGQRFYRLEITKP